MIAENANCGLCSHVYHPGGGISRGCCQKCIVVGKAHVNYGISVYTEGEIWILERWFSIPSGLEEPHSTFFISNRCQGIC